MIEVSMSPQRDYAISGLDNVLTPALAIYTDAVANNIDFTLELMAGDASRWRPHVKTAKASSTMKALVQRGVTQFKCATTLELLTACRSGARDVLIAYPLIGPSVVRVQEIAGEFSTTQISALVDDGCQLEPWRGSKVGLFIDINPGIDRAGVSQADVERIALLASAIRRAGIRFRGLHYYDGHLHDPDMSKRTAQAHRGYDRLMEIANAVESSGSKVEEIITSGTPAFPCALSYAPFRHASFVHRTSAGTVVYSDATSAEQLPREYRYRPAAIVLARVVSHPRENIVTCDAGHKTLSVDTGVPNCVVLGLPNLKPLKPSEEHLPLEVAPGSDVPQIGDVLYIVPRHVCPTVNNFDHALLVRNGSIVRVEPVSARGREAPLLAMATQV